ncbi:MAG: peptidoglycan-binding protein [Clostridia bacterium]|nr:peptidoglycan-binding protein [Clostridia bacterium]
MRRLLCLAAAALLLLTALPAVGEEEEVIAPAWPVPEYVTWLLDVARGELGYTEGRGGFTKYGEWAGDPYAEWCAEFLCWCVDQVDQQHGTQLLNNVYPRYSGTNTGLNWFLREGRYVSRTGFVTGWGSQWYIGEEESLPSGGYIPQPGDWVFYTADASGDTSHVAMVEYCTRAADGTVVVHSIEGNMPDKVQRATHTLTEWQVLGYGTVHDVADIVLTGGCKGRKVTALQERLRYLGYLDEQYITGEYGPSNAQAVRDFQTDTGKVPTGIANHHTQLTLNQMYWEAYWLDDSNFQVREELTDARYGADPEF